MTERLTTTEAVCRLCWHLMHGEGMTTAQAAELVGRHWTSAYRMLESMSRYLPIYQDDDKVWQLEATKETSPGDRPGL